MIFHTKWWGVGVYQVNSSEWNNFFAEIAGKFKQLILNTEF